MDGGADAGALVEMRAAAAAYQFPELPTCPGAQARGS